MQATPPASPRPPQSGVHRVVREPEDRKIAGVCSGLADALGVDVTVVRLAAVVLALFTMAAVVAYVVAAFAIPLRRPDEPRVRAPENRLGNVPTPIIVIVALVAVGAAIDNAWWRRPLPLGLALVAVGVWLLVRPRDERTGDHVLPTDPQQSDAQGDDATTIPTHDGDQTLIDLTLPSKGAGSPGEPPPPGSTRPTGDLAPPAVDPTLPLTAATAPPAPPAPARAPERARAGLGPVVVALLLVGGGALWLLDTVDVVSVSVSDGLGLGLVIVGACLIVAAWRGRPGVLVPLAVVLAGLLVAGESLDVPLDAGTGERTVVVDTPGELRRHHELWAGDLTVDLREAALPATGTADVEASVAIGQLEVFVPPEATVAVDAHLTAGEVSSPGGPEANESGLGVDSSFTLAGPPGGPRLHLDLSAGWGQVEITRG
jgi:phage shock protein PspC (stress-responsive transcriptional regulator)